MTFAPDRRSYGLTAGLLALALAVGVLAGVDPKLGLAAAMGLAFVTIVMADLSVGLCLYAVLAFLNVADASGSFVSFDKVAGGLLALSWLATVGASKGARRAFAQAHPYITALLLFFLVWSAMSIIWSPYPGEAVQPMSRYVLDAFLFAIVFTAIRRRRHVEWLITAFVTAATLSAVYGLVSPPAANDDRLTGTIGDPNQLAAVLVAGLVLAAALAITLKKSPLLRVTAAGCAFICLIATFLTLSRGGLIALVVAMVAAAFAAGRWRPPALALGASVVLAVVVFFAFVATPAQRQRVTSVNGGTGRADIWTVGWRMVAAHPLTGVGAGQFQLVSRSYLLAPGTIQRSDLIIETPKVAHNIYLQVLAELGVVGLIPFLAFLAFSLACALRAAKLFERRRDTRMEVLARGVFVALVGLLSADFFVSDQYSKQLWLLLGLAPALLSIARGGDDAEESVGGDRRASTTAPLAPRRIEPAPTLPRGAAATP